MHTGSCLCGTVRYEFDGPIGLMMNCHCSMCRKHHGAAYATFVAVPLAGFRWQGGQAAIREYASSSRGKRYFCRLCGSVVPTLAAGMQLALIPAGNVLGDLEVHPQLHAFAASKAPWYEITDSLPQHAEYPPEWGATALARPHVDARPGVVDGSCLCGDVAYELRGTPQRMVNCYCSRCRRARSAAHATNLMYPLEALRFVRGEDGVIDYQFVEAKYFGTAFCARCGAKVPRKSTARGITVVAAGALDTDPGTRPTMHMCVASKADWVQITDAMPQFAELAPLPATPAAPRQDAAPQRPRH